MDLDFTEPMNVTSDPYFSKIKIEQLEDAQEILDSKCFVDQSIDEGKIWVPGFSNNEIEGTSFELVDVKFEVNSPSTESALPKFLAEQSEDVTVKEESKCLVDQFIGIGQIWDTEESLNNGFDDYIKHEVKEDTDSHEIDDSRCLSSNVSKIPETIVTQHDVKDIHLKINQDCDPSDSNSDNSRVKDQNCHICEYRTCRKADLKTHVEATHLGLKDHKCHLCQYSAGRKNNLKRHIDGVHLAIKNHKCHLCQFSTPQKNVLKKHIKCVHMRMKNKTCHFCEFNTGYQTALKQHIEAVHMGIKGHKCHICDYSTSRSSDLKTHVNVTHLGIKNHKCHLCQYSSGRKSVLKNHINRCHLGMKNHKCHLCKYSAYHKANLKKHIDAFHHGIKNHKCQYCEHSTDRKDSLKKHIDVVHLRSQMSQ